MPSHSSIGSLEVRDLRKSFKRGEGVLPVLSGLTFRAAEGEVLAILGKSGAGKSTLLNLISGLEDPDTGSVVREGKVSYAPQRDLLLPWRTVESNVLLPFEIQGAVTDERKELVRSLLHRLELSEFKNSYPGELSGGMRQKVALARSLALDVPVYLFDEALSAIDFDSRLKLVKEIRSFIKDKNKIGVFITHNIEEAVSVADRVLVLSPRPASIIHETIITIPEADREPVSLRKNPEFQKQFEELWRVMARA